MRPELKELLRDYVGNVRRDDAFGLAAELAYRFLFALFPFGIFVAAFLAYASQWVGVESAPQQIVDGVGDNLPPDLAATIRPELERVIGETRPGLLSIGALAALWSANGATLALVKTMNRAYDVEDERPFLRRYATALLLTLLAAVGIIASFVSIVGGTLVTEELADRFGWGGTAWAVANVLRWPAAFALLTVAVGVLLRLAPNVAAPWRLTLAGGAVFALGWLGATFGFAWYVGNVANYGSTYGALAGVIVLMIWFYWSALILVLVAHLVALATKRVAPARIEQSREERTALDGLQHAAVGAVASLTDSGEDRSKADASPAAPGRGPRDPGKADGAADLAPTPATRAADLAPTPATRADRPSPPRGTRRPVPVAIASAAAGAAAALLVSVVAHGLRRNGS